MQQFSVKNACISSGTEWRPVRKWCSHVQWNQARMMFMSKTKKETLKAVVFLRTTIICLFLSYYYLLSFKQGMVTILYVDTWPNIPSYFEFCFSFHQLPRKISGNSLLYYFLDNQSIWNSCLLGLKTRLKCSSEVVKIKTTSLKGLQFSEEARRSVEVVIILARVVATSHQFGPARSFSQLFGAQRIG